MLVKQWLRLVFVECNTLKINDLGVKEIENTTENINESFYKKRRKK